MVDSGVAARLLRLTPEKLSRPEPPALAELGHLLETFVVGELMKQASWLDGIAGLGHWRTRDDDEIDLIIEHDDGTVFAFEVKASQRVADRDLRAMKKLQTAAGTRFATGVVLYLGSQSYRADDRLLVLPVDTLWAV
jgi:predicted AAA+ superfamily ATPase